MDKSPGPNKVAAHVLKDCLDVILGPLPDIVNCSILTSSFPAKWKAEVIPILKYGDHEVPYYMKFWQHFNLAILAIFQKITKLKCTKIKCR